MATAGLALAGLAGGYAGVLACVVGSGLGIAAFHPEAARVANRISGERTATGLAWFMVGGNAGLRGRARCSRRSSSRCSTSAPRSSSWCPAPSSAAWLLTTSARAWRSRWSRAPPATAAGRASADHRGRSALLLVVTSLRTWTQFCAAALVPLLLANERGFSDQAAGFAVVGLRRGAAPLGTLAGAALAERIGGRRMLLVDACRS